MTDNKIIKDEDRESQHDEDETEYPPTKKVLPVMAAIWLAFFVVALVNDSQLGPFDSSE